MTKGKAVDQYTRCTWARTPLGIAYLVGPTICYAFMQAVGMVNDHTIDCFRYERVGQTAGRGLLSDKRSPTSAAGAIKPRRG